VGMDAERADALTWKQLSAFIDVLIDAYVGRNDFGCGSFEVS